MNKTLGNIFENYIGIFLGILIAVSLYFHWFEGSVILKDKYHDIIVKLSASIFGFLLTILTLIVNSSNSNVVLLREHKNYGKLIKFNRASVFLCFFIIVFSVILFLILSPLNGLLDFSNQFGIVTFKVLICFHTFLCIWCVIDTFVFVWIFFKIILTDVK